MNRIQYFSVSVDHNEVQSNRNVVLSFVSCSVKTANSLRELSVQPWLNSGEGIIMFVYAKIKKYTMLQSIARLISKGVTTNLPCG